MAKVWLDTPEFQITSTLFGAFKVTHKERGFTRKLAPIESGYLWATSSNGWGSRSRPICSMRRISTQRAGGWQISSSR